MVGLEGGDHLEQITLHNPQSGEQRDGKVTSLWPLPRCPMLLETSMPGVFAVGDTRSCSVKRVARGVGEGSVVVQFVHHFLAGL